MPFVEPRDLGPKPWGQELLLCETPLYTLKRLTYEAGHQGALQHHERKDEAFHIAAGVARVTWVDADHLIVQIATPGQTFHVPRGMPHKFEAITRCVVYEASNPVFDDRVNDSGQYGDEDGEAR